MNQFIENFQSVDDIIHSYQGTSAEDLKDATIHLAWYGYGDYCGSSIVVYEKDGKLYVVDGSHCSCNGLEECWSPEETSWVLLSQRDFYGSSCDGNAEAITFLRELIAQHLN